MGIPWECHRNILGTSLEYSRIAMGVTMGTLWEYYGNSVGMQQEYYGNPMGTPKEHYVNTMGIP